MYSVVNSINLFFFFSFFNSGTNVMHWKITSGNSLLFFVENIYLPFVENFNCVLVKRKRSLN